MFTFMFVDVHDTCRGQKSVRFPGFGVLMFVSCHVDAGIQTKFPAKAANDLNRQATFPTLFL